MRFRLYPTAEQEVILAEHCAHARYVWNLALEQANCWRPGRPSSPGHLERCRQLTEVRAEAAWLAAGSQIVQQQSLRDFDQAMRNFFKGTFRRPTWRKKGKHEGFRQVGMLPGHVVRLNRRWGQVHVPKAGMVRFRWTRQVPADVKSYRVTLDASGRWHVAFAKKPEQIAGPGTGEIVGIDRGITLTLALSDGTTFQSPPPSGVRRAARQLSRAKRGSNRRQKAKHRVAVLKAHDAARRKDWAEKTSTTIARRYDIVRIEDLKIRNMTRSAKGTIAAPGTRVAQKRGLNRSILASGWGMFARRLEDKIGHRLEKVPPAYTSQRCSACGHVHRDNRESQASFRCLACNFVTNADVNAARNIAAGHAVTARRGQGVVDLPLKREPHSLLT